MTGTDYQTLRKPKAARTLVLRHAVTLADSLLVRLYQPVILGVATDAQLDNWHEYYAGYKIGPIAGSRTFAALGPAAFKKQYRESTVNIPATSVVLHLWYDNWKSVPPCPPSVEPFAQHVRLTSGGWSHGSDQCFKDQHPAWLIHETSDVPATTAWLHEAARRAYVGCGGTNLRST